MDGVIILSQEEIMVEKSWVITLLLVSIICISICVLLCTVNFKSVQCVFAFGIIGIIGIMMSLVFSDQPFGMKPTGQYKYEVVLTDEVDWKEFYDQYEIIDTKGEIYIIKDKG